MQELTIEEMEQLEGEGFWTGFICGGSVVATIAVWLSPEPISKLAMVSLASGVATCFV